MWFCTVQIEPWGKLTDTFYIIMTSMGKVQCRYSLLVYHRDEVHINNRRKLEMNNLFIALQYCIYILYNYIL